MKISKKNRVQRTRPLPKHKRGVMLHCNLENESITIDPTEIPDELEPEIPDVQVTTSTMSKNAPDQIDIPNVQVRGSTTSKNASDVQVRGSKTSKNAPVRKTWTKSDMEGAIKDVEDNEYSIRAAANKWGIPNTTLSFWLQGLTTSTKRGSSTILSDEEEMEIVQWCQDMAEMGYGLEITQLKTYVAHICDTRANPFKNGFPGKSWWKGFKKRHPELALRTTEGIDKDRATMLRPSIVAAFYENLAKIYKGKQYGPHQIWNCDETGVQAGRNCGMRVIAKKGSISVPYIVSKSREWITILCCVNAAGQSIPGFYLFKGQRPLKNYIVGCEPGACMVAQPHAWMTKELFLNWLHHFARSVPGGVSPNNRHLLIFDGHGSHVALPTIQEARFLGIDLITLPAHTSHKLQPLDVSIFSPFKNYFKSERSEWMAKHHRLVINRSELASLCSLAFKKALTVDNIKAGFKRTGIWPLNPMVLINDMNPSRGFNVGVEEEDETISIESILRFTGVSESDIHESVEQFQRENVAIEMQLQQDSTTAEQGQGQLDSTTAEQGQGQLDSTTAEQGQGQLDSATTEQGQGHHDSATAEQGQGHHDSATAE